MNDKIDNYAKILWNYHRLNEKITRSDAILAFGSHDLNVAKRAAKLYLDGYAELIIFTGGFGRITKSLWNKTEAEKFKEIAVAAGVSEDKILVEVNASNTGENISLTKKLLKENNISAKSFIIVEKPYRERRTMATLKKQWPEIKFTMASPLYTYEDYLKFYDEGELGISSHEFISIMVGDLQRIIEYSKLGFQIEQAVPDYVIEAYENLIKLGFTEHLIVCK